MVQFDNQNNKELHISISAQILKRSKKVSKKYSAVALKSLISVWCFFLENPNEILRES